MKKENTFPLESWLPFGFLAAALILYWPSLSVFFSLDDLRFLLRAEGLEESPGGVKRILSVQIYFRAAWALLGTRAHLYHLVSIFLHAANAYLVYKVALRLKLTGFAGVSAAVLFMVSTAAFLPLHWISGIQEVSVTFFALLAAWFYLGSGSLSIVFTLVAAALSLLCKETSLLLLPGLAIAIKAPKRRRLILGLGGLLLGAGFLIVSGSLEPRPHGNPYETVFGINILWNLLTYNAWIVRVWDYFPDRIPQYQTGLALWGSILPVILCVIAWRYPKTRRPIGRSSLLFIALLFPVLGLVRHSYLYYLYLPLIPFWLLSGAALGRISKQNLASSILVLAAVCSVASGLLHRGAEIKKGVPLDPILRYAAIARRGISALADSGHIPDGKILFVRSFEGESVDLAKGLDGRTGTGHRKVHLFRVALLDGDALGLFFPRIDSVHFEGPSGPVPGWHDMHFYGTFGVAEVVHLGYGEDGRMRFISDLMAAEMYERAGRETEIMMARIPDKPSLLFIKGRIALKRGDAAGFSDVLDRLRSIPADEDRDDDPASMIDELKRLSRKENQP